MTEQTIPKEYYQELSKAQALVLAYQDTIIELQQANEKLQQELAHNKLIYDSLVEASSDVGERTPNQCEDCKFWHHWNDSTFDYCRECRQTYCVKDECRIGKCRNGADHVPDF